MSRYVVSPAAQADVEDIWDYTSERWGEDQAEVYLRAIQPAVERVAFQPNLGRQCDDIRTGYRKLASGSHVLFYRQNEDNAVEVVRILHQRVDVNRHFE